MLSDSSMPYMVAGTNLSLSCKFIAAELSGKEWKQWEPVIQNWYTNTNWKPRKTHGGSLTDIAGAVVHSYCETQKERGKKNARSDTLPWYSCERSKVQDTCSEEGHKEGSILE